MMWRHRHQAARAAALAMACLVALGPDDAAAQRVRVKLATLAPDGSPWHRVLEDMGHEWQQATNGRVRLVIYPRATIGPRCARSGTASSRLLR